MKKFLLSIFAVLFAFAGVQAQVWTKVTDASTLKAGDQLVIACSSKGTVASSTISSNYMGKVDVTFSSDKSTITSLPSGAAILTLGGSKDAWTLANASGTQLGATGVKKVAWVGGTKTWKISIANGSATIQSTTSTYGRFLYNRDSPRFTTYTSSASASMILPELYRLETTDEVVVLPPTLTPSCEFVSSMVVEIEAESGDIYYSLDSEDGDFYEYPSDGIEIEETVTVYAKVVDGENESAVVSKTYTRVAATPVVTFDGDGKFGDELVVTITAENAKAYYTLDGKEPTVKSTEYTKPLTIKADATLKVVAIEEGGYESSVVENEFKLQAAASAGNAETATLVTDVEELEVGNQIIIVATDSKVALSTTQNNNNRGQIYAERTADKSVVTLNSDIQVITLEEGKQAGTFAFNVGGGYLYAASSSGNYLRTKTTLDDNGSWKIEISESGVANIKAQGSYTHNLLRYNEQSSLFSCYGSGLQDLSIYKVDVAAVEDYVLDVTNVGWATLYLGYNVVIPEDVDCYVIGEIDGAVVNLNQVEGILPANTAVIVEAEEGEYTFEVTEETATVVNLMEGTLKNQYITKDAYVLGIVDGEVGLYKAEMAGGVWLNNANKAYLPATAANGAASYSFRFGEGTTAIENVEVENVVKAIYDLTGRRIEAITAPGIYIVGGKKVLVK